MQKKLILFDCDGTLVDSANHIIEAIRLSFSHCDLDVPDEQSIRDIIGLSLHEAVVQLVPDAGSDVELALSDAYRTFYRAQVQASEEEMFPHVEETLCHLKDSGFYIGIVTGKSRAGLDRVMQRFSWQQFVSVSRTASECPSKPHPAMALDCAKDMAVSPGMCLVVGDSHLDMGMAGSAGMPAVGVSYGAQSSERLIQAGASYVIHGIRELLDLSYVDGA